MLQQPSQQVLWGLLLAFLTAFLKSLYLLVGEDPEAVGPAPPHPRKITCDIKHNCCDGHKKKSNTLYCNTLLMEQETNYFYQRCTFSRVCLILVTCVWITSQAFDYRFSVFKLSNLYFSNHLYIAAFILQNTEYHLRFLITVCYLCYAFIDLP